jgi:hypothetical protein
MKAVRERTSKAMWKSLHDRLYVNASGAQTPLELDVKLARNRFHFIGKRRLRGPPREFTS